MIFDKLTAEVSAEDVARSYANQIGCVFISHNLISELLAIPEVNKMMVYHPEKIKYSLYEPTETK